MNNCRLKLVLLVQCGPSPRLTKLVSISRFFILYSWKIVCISMQCIIFQYGWESVPIHWILIGLKALLQKFFNWSIMSPLSHDLIIKYRLPSFFLTHTHFWRHSTVYQQERECSMLVYIYFIPRLLEN